jgi:hypothetical protein
MGKNWVRGEKITAGLVAGNGNLFKAAWNGGPDNVQRSTFKGAEAGGGGFAHEKAGLVGLSHVQKALFLNMGRFSCIENANFYTWPSAHASS